MFLASFWWWCCTAHVVWSKVWAQEECARRADKSVWIDTTCLEIWIIQCKVHVVGDAKDWIRQEFQSSVDPNNCNLHSEVWSKWKVHFVFPAEYFSIEIVLFSSQLRSCICPENNICVVLTAILRLLQIFLYLTSVYRSWCCSWSLSESFVFREPGDFVESWLNLGNLSLQNYCPTWLWSWQNYWWGWMSEF